MLGVKYALIIAIATGFLELIPLVGPWIAGAIAVTVSLFQDTRRSAGPTLSLAIVIGLAYFAPSAGRGCFRDPDGDRAVRPSPSAPGHLLVVVGTTLGGILGLILAVPIAAVSRS